MSINKDNINNIDSKNNIKDTKNLKESINNDSSKYSTKTITNECSKKSYFKRNVFLLILLLILLVIIAREKNFDKLAKTNGLSLSGNVVILDAGHGGIDPGSTSSNIMSEADINIMITHKLKQYLEQSGVYVILTRNGKDALSNNKKEDMKLRRELLEQSKAAIALSIHQNSYTDSKYKGAQVFFPQDHEQSKTLARCIQDSLRENLDNENKREIKTEKYYIFDNITLPTVICECGFLSNYEDSENLTNEKYQENVAWAIYLGINEYFKGATK